MKEKEKIGLLELLKNHVSFCDGFWIKDGELVTQEEVRQFIKMQGIQILEKDVTDCISELSFNRTNFDIETHYQNRIASLSSYNGKSKYFEMMDKLYPGNKFRELFNYYLFSREEYCFIMVGYGQTGKSTLVNLLAKIVGEGYFGRSSVALLRNQHGLATLEGKLLYEVNEAQDLDLDTANMLKSIITHDEITVNPKFEQMRKIKPHAKMIMTCNSIPRFKVTDDGVIRRTIIVRMCNKIEQQNPNFLNEIAEDIPNIIMEALLNPFNIEHFAKEQYVLFETDPQFGFGYGGYDGEKLSQPGRTIYEKYREYCRTFGYMPKSYKNFELTIQLEEIYRKRCDTTSKDYLASNGAF